MNKRQALEVQQKMATANWTQTMLMHATYKNGTKGWEAIGCPPNQPAPERIASPEAWDQRQQQEAQP